MKIKYQNAYKTLRTVPDSKHSKVLIIITVVTYRQYIHNKNNIRITIITDEDRKMKHTCVCRQSPLQTRRLLGTQSVSVCPLLDPAERSPHEEGFVGSCT